MKKIAIAAILIVSSILSSPIFGSEIPKEVSFSDLFNTYQSAKTYVDYMINSISNNESDKTFGYFDSKYTSSTEAFYEGELSAFFYLQSFSDPHALVTMGDYVKITAEIGDYYTLEANNLKDNTWQLAEIDRNGKYRIGLVEDSWNITFENQLFIRTDDDSFKQLRQGSVATIEGYYIPYGRISSQDVLYDCKLVEFH